MIQFAVITQAETVYDANLGRFLAFVTFTTPETPSDYNYWFEIGNIKGGATSKKKLVKLLEATSAKSIEDMKCKIVKVQTVCSTMTAFCHINKDEWTTLYDFERTK